MTISTIVEMFHIQKEIPNIYTRGNFVHVYNQLPIVITERENQLPYYAVSKQSLIEAAKVLFEIFG